MRDRASEVDKVVANSSSVDASVERRDSRDETHTRLGVKEGDVLNSTTGLNISLSY